MAAANLKDKIILFGGHSTASYRTQIYTEEAVLLKDKSKSPLIPGSMCQNAYAVQEEKLFVLNNQKINKI